MNYFDCLPKIDLHLHFDGSLDYEYVKNKYNLSDNEICDKMISRDSNSLSDYLTKFDFSLSILQTKEELSDALISLLKKLKKQNLIYCEIRFAPSLHTKFLTQDEVVKCLIEAKNKVDIKSNLILCMMRNNSDDINIETINVCKKYLGKGVCGIDLAGDESKYKTMEFKHLFKLCNDSNIPFTIHCGEADGIESIKSAISFGAKRLGHGVRCIEDSNLVKYIHDNNIYLEVCITSNINTGLFEYPNHPIEYLYNNVLVTINTDNMMVSDTNLDKEYDYILKNTDLCKEDIIKMNLNSIDCAFLSDTEKKLLKEKYMSNI